jgi:hypothetical protein
VLGLCWPGIHPSSRHSATPFNPYLMRLKAVFPRAEVLQ